MWVGGCILNYVRLIITSEISCIQGDSEISLEKKCGVSLIQNNSA
jgi:hypothetical protein